MIQEAIRRKINMAASRQTKRAVPTIILTQFFLDAVLNTREPQLEGKFCVAKL